MSWAFSEMTMADYNAVIAFWNGQPGIVLNESDSREAIGMFLARNPGMSLVARDGAGRIVGAVMCGHDGRRGYLHHLCVAAQWRRKGLGRALVEACVRLLRAAGIDRCNAVLLADNEQGRRFWRAAGFEHRVELALLQYRVR